MEAFTVLIKISQPEILHGHQGGEEVTFKNLQLLLSLGSRSVSSAVVAGSALVTAARRAAF